MLTVLMPVGSMDEFLPSAFRSIQNQTYKDFVCHILCGKLGDDELKAIVELVSKDERFVLHHLHLNGISFALNYGVNLVKTKYVARMDSDDISHPLRFEKQINFLEESPEYIMVGCRVNLIDERGDEVKQQFKFFESDKAIRKALRYRMPLCHPAIMFRSQILFTHRGYMYGNTSEDHELYLRIARNPKNLFKNLPDHLFSYRRHVNQLTDSSNAWRAYCNIAGFLFTEFMLTKHPVYLLGILASHPLLRKIRLFLRKPPKPGL
tara:strand:+ start:1220 stop:2011 length:792 start_codon:yes stop_codon:yes gene_type:complete